MANSVYDRVFERIDARAPEIIEFLRGLVRIRSVNPVFLTSQPLEERQCQEFIAAELKQIGFQKFDFWEPDPEALRNKYLGKPGYTANRKFENRPNLYALLPGSGGGKSIFLTAHIDTVGADPQKEAWKHDPWAAVVEDGRLYGRGSADMKGGIAAMIQAVKSIRAAGLKLKGDVHFGTVVDEETGSMGMLALVDRGYRADVGIMPEPTQLRLSLLCRGIIWGHIRIRGKSGHIEVQQPSADKGGAVDALRYGRTLLDAIDGINRDWLSRDSKSHPLLPRPCEVSISMVRAGQHPSSFAETFECTVDIQYLPGERDVNGLGGAIKQEVEARIRQAFAGDTWFETHPVEFAWFVDADCGEVQSSHPFATLCSQSLESLGYPSAPVGSEFHTDMSLLTNNGTPTINLGPGDPFIAHQTNEYVPVQEVIDCTKAIARILLDWCGYMEGAQ
jgi:acetylornithine deacetylase